MMSTLPALAFWLSLFALVLREYRAQRAEERADASSVRRFDAFREEMRK